MCIRDRYVLKHAFGELEGEKLRPQLGAIARSFGEYVDMKAAALHGELSNTEYRFLPVLRSRKRRRPVAMEVIRVSNIMFGPPANVRVM